MDLRYKKSKCRIVIFVYFFNQTEFFERLLQVFKKERNVVLSNTVSSCHILETFSSFKVKITPLLG